MSNPIQIAAKGKGFLPMLRRGLLLTSRYSLTAQKMDKALSLLAQIFHQYACSATLPVTASSLASNLPVISKYYQQGLELAIHGLEHLDYSVLPLETQLEHFQQARQVFQQAGFQATGFRCPYLRWNQDTLQALSTSGFSYDGSQALAWDVVEGLEIEPYQRVLSFYRARSAREYTALPHLENGLVRFSYCLPDDEALVERLHLPGVDAMAEIWLDILYRTYQFGELFTLGLHPERAFLCQEALQAVLERARLLSPCIWIARLDEIVAWYHALGKSTFEIHQESGTLYHFRIQAPQGTTILTRSLGVLASSRPWGFGYRSVPPGKFTIRCSKRPVIGISPRSPFKLCDFLRHLGYLFEISTDPQNYTYYLDRSSFQELDERPLLTELDQGQLPLVRLASWPEGARSALAVTGDIDAFTLWDYGRRIWSN